MDILGAGAPAGGSGGKSANVIDGSDRTFMADVIEASRDMAVVVDFWAPWCGPCRTLGPIIEKVVDDQKGAVKLVKIDIDKNPAVAGQLGVQSIPAVIAFRNGRPVDGFMGALPEGKVREFIGRIKGATGEDAGPTVAEMLEAAEGMMDEGDFASAAEVYAAVLDAEEGNTDAIAGLARAYIKAGDMERARQIAELIPEDKRSAPAAASIFSILDLAAHVAAPDETLELATRVRNSPQDFDARFELAGVLAAQGKHEEAAEHLLTILEKNLNWNEGAAREQLFKVFEAAGPKSDVTRDGRRRLSSLSFR
jgi:putative thioredoxin